MIAVEIKKEMMPQINKALAGTGVGMIVKARVITQGKSPRASKYSLSINAAKETVIEVGTMARINAATRTIVLFSSNCQAIRTLFKIKGFAYRAEKIIVQRRTIVDEKVIKFL